VIQRVTSFSQTEGSSPRTHGINARQLRNSVGFVRSLRRYFQTRTLAYLALRRSRAASAIWRRVAPVMATTSAVAMTFHHGPVCGMIGH